MCSKRLENEYCGGHPVGCGRLKPISAIPCTFDPKRHRVDLLARRSRKIEILVALTFVSRCDPARVIWAPDGFEVAREDLADSDNIQSVDPIQRVIPDQLASPA